MRKLVNPKKGWARSDNMNELLRLLKTEGPLNYQSLRDKLHVSDPTLTGYIETLENENRIEHFSRPEDRRQTWYQIKPQSIQVDLRDGRPSHGPPHFVVIV